MMHELLIGTFTASLYRSRENMLKNPEMVVSDDECDTNARESERRWRSEVRTKQCGTAVSPA